MGSRRKKRRGRNGREEKKKGKRTDNSITITYQINKLNKRVKCGDEVGVAVVVRELGLSEREGFEAEAGKLVANGNAITYGVPGWVR